MAIQKAPITGNDELDAWAYDVTTQISCTMIPFIATGGAGGGASGADGTDGNITLFLYKRTANTSVPATPTSVNYNYVNIDNTTLTANLGWTAAIPSNSGGLYLWVTFRYVSAKAGSINNANSWDTPSVLAQDGAQGATGSTGSTGTTGSPAPRSTTRRLYRAATSSPSAPTATITWATSALSSITSGWSEVAPTQVASSTTYVYASYIVFSDATGASSTSTSTGGTAVQGTSFSGIVTFASGDFNVNGNAITTIDGGNINTDTITAKQLAVSSDDGVIYTTLPTGSSTGVVRQACTGMYFNSVHNRIEIWSSGVLRSALGSLLLIPTNNP